MIPTRNHPDWRNVGEPQSLDELRRLDDLARQMDLVDSDVPMDGGQSGPGFAPGVMRPRGLWARLTASGTDGTYSWVQVARDPSLGTYETVAEGLQGSYAGDDAGPAIEVNLDGTLEASEGTGAIVYLELADDGEAWEFSAGSQVLPVLTVREIDGSPSVSPVTTLRFDQAAGLRVSSPFAGAADVTLQQASTSLVGYVSTGDQAFAGLKDFTDGLTGHGESLYADTSLAEVWLSGYDLSSGEVGAAWWVDGTLSGSHQNVFFHVGPYGATPANYWRLSDEGFQLAGGAFMVGAAVGQSVTDSGVTYTSGLRTGGTLNVTAAVSSALAALGGVTLNI